MKPACFCPLETQAASRQRALRPGRRALAAPGRRLVAAVPLLVQPDDPVDRLAEAARRRAAGGGQALVAGADERLGLVEALLPGEAGAQGAAGVCDLPVAGRQLLRAASQGLAQQRLAFGRPALAGQQQTKAEQGL